MGDKPARATTMADAKAVRAAVFGQLAGHIKLCAQCARHRANPHFYCTDGYQLAKDLAAANADIERLRPKGGPPQGALF